MLIRSNQVMPKRRAIGGNERHKNCIASRDQHRPPHQQGKQLKTREEAARFIEKQIHWKYECSRNKEYRHHYGLQELRELMDFIYESLPEDIERINKPAR